MTTATLAFTIIVVILAQIAVVALTGLYHRRAQYRSLEKQKSKTETLSTPQTSMWAAAFTTIKAVCYSA